MSIRWLYGTALAIVLLMPRDVKATPLLAFLNLHLSDLPVGFVQDTYQIKSGVQLAKEPGYHANAITNGRLVWFSDAEFARHRPAGLRSIQSVVYQYATPLAAHQAWASYGLAANWRPVGVNRLGQERTCGVLDGLPLGRDIGTQYECAFRRGKYFMLLVVSGVQGTFSSVQTFTFDRLLDQRIRHAG